MTNQDAQGYLALYIKSAKKMKLNSKTLKNVKIIITNGTSIQRNFKMKILQVPATATIFDLFCQLDYLRVCFIDKQNRIFSGLAEDLTSDFEKGVCFNEALTRLVARNLYSQATGKELTDETEAAFRESQNITLQFGAVLGLSDNGFCLLREKINKGREEIRRLFNSLNSKLSYGAFEGKCDLLHFLNKSSKGPFGNTGRDADELRKSINDILMQTMELGFLNNKFNKKELLKRFEDFNYYTPNLLKADMKNRITAFLENQTNNV